MALLKFGENITFDTSNIQPASIIMQDDEMHTRFKKLAANIKKVAPKADDFLYFTAIMMHAAERSIYDDNGGLRKDANGADVTVKWDIDPKTGSWKWNCSDPTINPYKNNNGDIFPEKELKIAVKKWIGKPLCKDHQSNSVDGMRGILLDTYWDDKHKRIIALCALDKINYPDLARKVSSGYANCVSMGTAVGNSICTTCGNVATTEAEYCDHVKNKTAYGEININLSPIELSLVVNGADTRAKVLEVLAAATDLSTNLAKTGLTNAASQANILKLEAQFQKLSVRIDELEKEIRANGLDRENLLKENDNNSALKKAAHLEEKESESLLNLIKYKMSDLEGTLQVIAKTLSMEDLMPQDIKRKGYWQGTEEPKPGQSQYEKENADSIRDNQDTQMTGLTNLGPVDGLPPQDLETKKKLARATVEERRNLRAAAVERAKQSLKTSTKVAYPQGTEPQKTYPVDPGAKVRETEFTINNNMGKLDGLYPDDKELKAKLHRASLKAVLSKVANNAGNNKLDIVNKDNNEVIFSATFAELAGNKPTLYASIATEQFARQLMKTIKSVGVNETVKLYKGAQAAPAEAPVAAPEAAPPAVEEEVAAVIPEPDEAPIGEEAGVASEEGAKQEAILAALEGLKDVLDTTLAGIEQAEEPLAEESEAFPEELVASVAEETPEGGAEAAIEEMGRAASISTSDLKKVNIMLNAGLADEFKKNAELLRTCKKEVELLLSATISNDNMGFFTKLAEEAKKDAVKAIKHAQTLKVAFVKYARGVYALDKRTQLENTMEKTACGAGISYADELPDSGLNSFDPDSSDPSAMLAKELETFIAQQPPGWEDYEEGQMPTEMDVDAPFEPPTIASNEFNMKTAEGRSAYRNKLAATIGSKIQFSDMISKAHPKGGTKLDGIAGTSENYVETGPEVSQDVQQAVSHEPKVKKAAAELDRLIKAGRINAADLPEMIKEGLDSEVANYWKKYYNQVEGGGEFAAALLKDYTGAKQSEKKAEDSEALKAKITRGYDLAYEMANVGLIAKNRDAIRKEADKISTFNDEAYESLGRVVKHHLSKTASSNSVQVGVALDSESVTGPSTGGELLDQFISAFAGRKY